jgi:hypothetical protein
MHHFVSAFGQIPLGAWSPIKNGSEYLTLWSHAFSTSPAAAVGILAAKMAAFHFFPIGGGAPTQMIADWGQSADHELIDKIATFSALIGMGITGLWVFSALYVAIAQ